MKPIILPWVKLRDTLFTVSPLVVPVWSRGEEGGGGFTESGYSSPLARSRVNFLACSGGCREQKCFLSSSSEQQEGYALGLCPSFLYSPNKFCFLSPDSRVSVLSMGARAILEESTIRSHKTLVPKPNGQVPMLRNMTRESETIVWDLPLSGLLQTHFY